MPAAKPGEVWMIDLGMAAKVRPSLILTRPPKPDELDVFKRLIKLNTNENPYPPLSQVQSSAFTRFGV